MRKTLSCSLVALFLLTPAACSVRADALAAFEITVDNIAGARLGETVDVSIQSIAGSELFSSFVLVISFDVADLQLIDILEGAAVTGCGWQVFQYQQLPCPGCDRQVFQITAAAGGASCFLTTGELARLRIKLPVDPAFAGEVFTVDFYWQDCTSNVAASLQADTSWFGKFAYDYLGNDLTGSDPHLGSTIPGCVAPDGVVPVRGINYRSGSVALSSELGLYGDINGDGHLNIADAAYLIAYLYRGGPDPQDYLFGDVNMSGTTNVADALFLMDYLFGLQSPP